MFTSEDLVSLVESARDALAEEDKYVTECLKAQGWQHDRGGIRENTNERYYQFVIWRGLLKSFRLRPRTEKKYYDLSFHDPTDQRSEVAVAEIKGYWSDSGETEIGGIKKDIVKLSQAKSPGVMLVLTTHRADQAKSNYARLAQDLSLTTSVFVHREFRTEPWKGQTGDYIFDVIAFLVPNASSTPA